MVERLTDEVKAQRAAKRALTRSSEKAFDAQVVDLIKRFGWRWVGFHKLPVNIAGPGGQKRFLTPIRGDGKGWPDLFLLHPRWGRIMWIELKASDGRPAPDQLVWLYLLEDLGMEAHLLYPRDIFTAGTILGKPARHPNLLPARPAAQPRLGEA